MGTRRRAPPLRVMAMRNPCLDAALRELDAAGIRDVEQAFGSKHPQLRWRVNGGALRIYSLPGTPSDWRSEHNTRAEIRRMLREDGVITVPERLPKPTPARRKLDRIAELERRVTALENWFQNAARGEHAT